MSCSLVCFTGYWLRVDVSLPSLSEPSTKRTRRVEASLEKVLSRPPQLNKLTILTRGCFAKRHFIPDLVERPATKL